MFLLVTIDRAETEAVVASMDIRNIFNRKHMTRYLESSDIYDRQEPVKKEPSRPDLRSRLSRANDW